MSLAKLNVPRLRMDWDHDAGKFVPLPEESHVRILMRARQVLLQASMCDGCFDATYLVPAEALKEVIDVWVCCLPKKEKGAKP